MHFFQKLTALPFVYFSVVGRTKGQQAMTRTAFGYTTDYSNYNIVNVERMYSRLTEVHQRNESYLICSSPDNRNILFRAFALKTKRKFSHIVPGCALFFLLDIPRIIPTTK